MLKAIKSFFVNLYTKKPKTTEVKVVTVNRITESVYKELVSGLPNPMVSPEDSPSVVAHKLGVQLALERIRKGIVVPD